MGKITCDGYILFCNTFFILGSISLHCIQLHGCLSLINFLPNGTLAAEASGLIQNDNQDNTTINKVGA